MKAIKERVGFKGSLQQFFEHMRTSSKQFYYPNTAAGKQTYLDETAEGARPGRGGSCRAISARCRRRRC